MAVGLPLRIEGHAFAGDADIVGEDGNNLVLPQTINKAGGFLGIHEALIAAIHNIGEGAGVAPPGPAR